jgi:hypothetical protein
VRGPARSRTLACSMVGDGSLAMNLSLSLGRSVDL